MIYCRQCGSSLEEHEKFCQFCGSKQDPEEKAAYGSPWRKLSIFLLSIFIVIGTSFLVYERLEERGVFADDPKDVELRGMPESEDPLLGVIYEEELQEDWSYPGGTIEKYRAYDVDGDALTIYRDGEKKETLGFSVELPLAEKVEVTQEEARQAAEEVASRTRFFDDPTLKLIETGLDSNMTIEGNPEAGSYYYFHWQAEDPQTGAKLLRQIKVRVHAETGKVRHLASHDYGEVHISTVPEVEKEEAAEVALVKSSGHFSQPGVVKKELFIAGFAEEQKLVWEIVVEETASQQEAAALWIYVDAATGEIMEIL